MVNLDVDSAKKFAEYIANLSQRKRIIVISHDEVFYRYAKVKYKIENKKMILQAINDETPGDVMPTPINT